MEQLTFCSLSPVFPPCKGTLELCVDSTPINTNRVYNQQITRYYWINQIDHHCWWW